MYTNFNSLLYHTQSCRFASLREYCTLEHSSTFEWPEKWGKEGPTQQLTCPQDRSWQSKRIKTRGLLSTLFQNDWLFNQVGGGKGRATLSSAWGGGGNLFQVVISYKREPAISYICQHNTVSASQSVSASESRNIFLKKLLYLYYCVLHEHYWLSVSFGKNLIIITKHIHPQLLLQCVRAVKRCPSLNLISFNFMSKNLMAR